MPRVGFEPTIPASKRAKTVHALDNSATVTGQSVRLYVYIARQRRRKNVTAATNAQVTI
jgi:hypothetical protein